MSDPGSVLVPVEEPQESYAPASAADVLRASIASDSARHGQWFQLSQYRPLPKRVALGIASSWRRCTPARFGGDRHFQARIMPVDVDGRGRRELVVTKTTSYAVAVRYPAASTTPVEPAQRVHEDVVNDGPMGHEEVMRSAEAEPETFGEPWVTQPGQ